MPDDEDADLHRRRHRQRERVRRACCRATRSSSTRPARRASPSSTITTTGCTASSRTSTRTSSTSTRWKGCRTSTTTIFGKTWAPNQIMPRWMIEGIAVYEESKRSAGRAQSRHALRPVHPHRAPRRRRPAARRGLRRAAAVPARQRGLRLRLALHALHLRSLRRRHAARDVAHLRCATRSPFAINRQIAKVVGKPFTELYDDWKAYLRDRYGMQEMAAERRGLRVGRALTHTAESNSVRRTTPPTAASCTGCSTTATRCATVRAIPVGADQRQRARRRADRRDGPVRSSRPTARSSTSRAGSFAATTRSRICSAGTRARTSYHAPDDRPCARAIRRCRPTSAASRSRKNEHIARACSR